MTPRPPTGVVRVEEPPMDMPGELPMESVPAVAPYSLRGGLLGDGSSWGLGGGLGRGPGTRLASRSFGLFLRPDLAFSVSDVLVRQSLAAADLPVSALSPESGRFGPAGRLC